MKIGIIYFSATNNTRKIAEIIGDSLTEKDIEVEYFDITAFKAREQKLDLKDFDGLIFGYPIYAGFAPRLIRDWFSKLEGNSQPCGLFATYGGVSTGIANYYTKLQLEKQDFIVVGAADFIGRHSYNIAEGWSFMQGRPSKEDIAVAKEYALKLYEKFKAKDRKALEIPKKSNADMLIEMANAPPPRKPVKRSVATPSRGDRKCQMCYDCENNCPTGAFSAEKGEADESKCIACMRCITNCPDKVLEINNLSEMYANIRKNMDISDEKLAKKESSYLV